MNVLELVILYSLLSGSSVFLGGVLSYYFGGHFKSGLIKAEIIHLSIAFGGGILIAAVGLVLVPKGIEELPLTSILISFASGTAALSLVFKIYPNRLMLL